MRTRALLAIVTLALAACAERQAVLSPSKRPGPPSATPAPPPPQPTPPAPAPPVRSAPSTPLTPQMSAEQERRLREDTQRKLNETERLLQQVEGRPLPPNEQETFRLARSFLAQARRALGTQEYERAANLVAKARTLTDDLTGTTK